MNESDAAPAGRCLNGRGTTCGKPHQTHIRMKIPIINRKGGVANSTTTIWVQRWPK
jgi:hypothetical protein